MNVVVIPEIKEFPPRISKSELKSRFTYSHTEQLQKVIFTDDWIFALGWTKEFYKKKRLFEIDETRQIFHMLKARRLL